MKKIAVLGALDTKGKEFEYLVDTIQSLGGDTLVIDTSVGGEAVFDRVIDISAEEVLEMCGVSKKEVQKMGRNDAIKVMKKSAVLTVHRLLTEERINGIITMCGGTGSSVVNTVYDSIPFGFPKVMLSTLPPLKGENEKLTLNDTLFMKSIVDISGLNDIMTSQMDSIAAAIVSLAGRYGQAKKEETGRRQPKIALTMFGVTTPCVSEVQKILTRQGYNTYVFHANGDGGFQMEKLIEQKFFDGVIDITMAEIVPELFEGADCYAGPKRLEAAGKTGIPCLFVPGALDVVNYVDFKASEKYDRVSHMHTAGLKVLRPNKEDSLKIGKLAAEKLNKGEGPAEIVFPLKGLSQTDVEGHPCYDAEANKELFDTLRDNLKPEIRVTELDYHINDTKFAEEIAKIFMERILPV